MALKLKSPVDVVIGCKYNVPSGVIKSLSHLRVLETDYCIPILFPCHKDGKEICVNEVANHYHIDHRFIKHDSDVYIETELSDIKYRTFECIGISTELKNPFVFSIEKLNRIYENVELKNNICPHQKISLVNSCGTCPGHGLTWDLKTRKLKFKLPFYLVNGKNKFVIKDGKCSGELIEPLVATCEPFTLVNYKIEFHMVDDNDVIIPNVKFELPYSYLDCKVGDTINITGCK